MNSSLLLEANAQLGAYFWWGSQQKNSYDTTMIPVLETAGAIPNINYRAENWSGHKGFTNIIKGSASYITGSHSAKVGFRLHQNIASTQSTSTTTRSSATCLRTAHPPG